MTVPVSPGALVRYKHDKNYVGLVVEVLPDRGKDILLVQWQSRRINGNSRWCVQPDHIQVRGVHWWVDVA